MVMQVKKLQKWWNDSFRNQKRLNFVQIRDELWIEKIIGIRRMWNIGKIQFLYFAF
jgi:hypothetical protein